MTPLVPARVDLRDFAFMPMEFGRLFSSDTWTLSNDAEKVAAITLWGKSWAQVPAGSLPDDDRLLAAHSGAGQRWKRVKEMALRGWRKADDGRLYHPVVCEKALEAWLGKLADRLSSGAGNAKRWGIEFDPTEIEANIQEARACLMRLNPQSRTLTKKRAMGIPLGSKKPPVGNADGIPSGVPLGSQGTGTGTGTGKKELFVGSFEAHTQDLSGQKPPESGVGDPQSAVVQAVVKLRKRGGLWLRLTPQQPAIIAAIGEGVSLEALEALAEAYPDKPPSYVISAARRQRAEPPQTMTAQPRGSPQPSKTLQAIQKLDRMINHAEQPENRLDTRRIGPGNAEDALPAPAGTTTGRRG